MSNWLEFLKAYHQDHPNLTYKQAMVEAATHWKTRTNKTGGSKAKREPVLSAVRQNVDTTSLPPKMITRDINVVGGKNNCRWTRPFTSATTAHVRGIFLRNTHERTPLARIPE